MSAALAILSMLHQSAGRPGSATRLFRNSPVLGWTVRRLAACRSLSGIIVICRPDQAAHVRQAAPAADVAVVDGPSRPAVVDLVSAARRWSDGWRGSLAGTCCHDLGFDAPAITRQLEQHSSDNAILVDPDSALVDPELIDGLSLHAERTPEARYVFMPVAPGLSGLLMRGELVQYFAEQGGYPGRALAYWPDLPARDPIGQPECAPYPTPAARTLSRFVLDSQRQIEKLTAATASLNGELASSSAATLVARVDAASPLDSLPKEIVLELTTARIARPNFQASTHLNITRPDLTPELAGQIARQAAAGEDTRITLAGVGDPLLHPRFLSIVEAITSAGVRAIHVETDLLGVSEGTIERLAKSPVDVVSVHLPATSVATYEKIMGVPRLPEALANLQGLVKHRGQQFLPIVVPVFTKCRDNLGEMENWYDYWLRNLGFAAIAGPTDFAGQIPDVSAADMTPPKRVPCRRLNSRLTVLSDGQITACEQDVCGSMTAGKFPDESLGGIWLKRLSVPRASHAAGQYPSLCAQCRQWHRP